MKIIVIYWYGVSTEFVDEKAGGIYAMLLFT